MTCLLRFTWYFFAFVCSPFCTAFLLAQETQVSLDSADMEFKAKLLTLTRLGLTDSGRVLEDVLSQEVHYQDTGSDQVILMRIPFEQHYFMNKGDRETALWGNCDFLIIYYRRNQQFYRIGGFGEGDVLAFMEELYWDDKIELFRYSFSKGLEEFSSEEFNIFDLSEYADLSERKRRRRSFPFIYNCEEQISPIVIIH